MPQIVADGADADLAIVERFPEPVGDERRSYRGRIGHKWREYAETGRGDDAVGHGAGRIADRG